MSSLPPLDWVHDPVDRLRDDYAADRLTIFDQCPDDVTISDFDFATGVGLRFTPAQLCSDTDILFLHGGGWIVGSPWTHRTLCSWMAKLTGRRVFAAPYRLAPEHKFPAQADDAVLLVDEFAAVRDQFVLAGDSAGGAMILWGEAGAAPHAKDKIAALVSLYGAFGVHDSASMRKYGGDGDSLGIRALLTMYAHLGCDDPSGFQAQLSKTGAPILLVRAQRDAVADDNDWLAAQSDRLITHLTAQGQEHAFLQFCGTDTDAADCMGQIANWLAGVTD